jgi:polyphosphate kinase 2 (PPK2 family)
VPEPVWKGRFAHINAFERLILDAGVIVLKFCLHIGADEQYERLRAREKDPRTAWKLNPEDWREVPLWDDFTEAYEDATHALREPATRPWYLVPADKKWFRNLAVMERPRAGRCGPTARSGSTP